MRELLTARDSLDRPMYGYAIHAQPHLASETLLPVWSLGLSDYACAAVRKKRGVQVDTH